MAASIHDLINNDQDDKLKEALLELKFMLKQHLGCQQMLEQTALAFSFVHSDYETLLHNGNAKVRQHAADCVAFFVTDDDRDMLIKAYSDDDILYNKEHYLLAMLNLDMHEYKDFLLEQFNSITAHISSSAEEMKHRICELRALVSVLRTVSERRLYVDGAKESEVVLLTNRNYKDLTMKELGKIPHKEFSAGVMAKTSHLAPIFKIRTFDELLFKPPFNGTVSEDCTVAAKALIESGITDYIYERVSEGELPVNFRLEVKSSDVSLKNKLMKVLPGLIETGSDYRLINSTGDYDVEIRLVQGGEGGFRPLLKFCMIKDQRFSYRKANLSTGMKPYLAALICRLTSEFMNDNAVVIDPFCGTGTLMIERNKCCPVRMMYGVDIYGKAIEAATVNINAAGMAGKTELINKDINSFSHKHKFNEVITDLPFNSTLKSEQDIACLIENFFKNFRKYLEEDNRLIIYTHNKSFLKKYAASYGYRVIKEFEISKKEEAYLFVLSYGG